MSMTHSVAMVLALGVYTGAWGQVLTDPTRPPQEWLAAQPKVVARAIAAAEEAVPQLQSLLIGPTRRYAIIEGQLVGEGDRFGDSKVVAVRATEVVLRSERGEQRLRLFPDVELRATVPARTHAGAKVLPKKGSYAGERPPNVIRESK